jgi:hypothetical protein
VSLARKPKREFTVAVFPHERGAKRRYMAYTLWYNPEWPGCCLHKIGYAPNGEQAKKWAIAELRAVCERAAERRPHGDAE